VRRIGPRLRRRNRGGQRLRAARRWCPLTTSASARTRRPRTVIVDNPADDAAITAHLTAAGGLAAGRAVIRPTPGAAGVGALGLDLLAAAGISAESARQEHVTGLCWEYARAWLTGHQVTDLLADRAHRLTAAQLEALGGLAAALRASLWLVWGSTSDPAAAITTLRQAAGREVERISLWDFHGQLRPAPPGTAASAGAGAWPVLPEADFITFLAACRRHLAPPEFAAVAGVYYDAADITDLWIELRRDVPGRSMARFAAVLTGWLRDDMLGPAPCPPAAMVRLRAVQAALFTRGVLLRWDAAALGPGPARRLPGDLAPARAAMLSACCDTGTAAAAALCLHLNHGTTHLGQLAISDIAPAGTVSRWLSSPTASWCGCRPARGPSSPRTWPTGSARAPPPPIRSSSTPAAPTTAARNASCATPSPAPVRPSDTRRHGCTATTADMEPTSASPPASRDGWPGEGCHCT
jgi:hypothetical protein